MTIQKIKTVVLLIVLAITIPTFGFKFITSFAEAEKKVEEPTRAFARAVEANKPRLAPEGGADYVRGVREYFGRIREARFLDAYTQRHGSGRAATTEVVSEMFVRGKRGAGVLEVNFDGTEIDGLWEIEPDDVHSDLDDATEAAVERGFAKRGGETANIVILNGAVTRAEVAEAAGR
jgi:hypothetical protein